MESLLEMDGAALLFIQQNIRTPLLTPLMRGVSILGDYGIFWIVLTLILLMFRKTRRAGLCSAAALVLSLVLNNLILKPLVMRTRPYEVIAGLEILTGRPIDFSFPSGHAGASFASATALARTLPRPWGILLLVLAGLIALSRLYVGVHYPTDVLAGVTDGIFLGLLAAWAVRRFLLRKEKLQSVFPAS